MLTDSRGVKDVPFEDFDTQVKSLRAPVSLAEGTSNGTAIQLPGVCRALFTQITGAINDSGSLVGTIEESATGSGGWTTVVTFTAAAANTVQKAYATLTQPYVRHVAVVTGGGSGTVLTSASVIY